MFQGDLILCILLKFYNLNPFSKKISKFKMFEKKLETLQSSLDSSYVKICLLEFQTILSQGNFCESGFINPSLLIFYPKKSCLCSSKSFFPATSTLTLSQWPTQFRHQSPPLLAYTKESNLRLYLQWKIIDSLQFEKGGEEVT